MMEEFKRSDFDFVIRLVDCSDADEETKDRICNCLLRERKRIWLKRLLGWGYE